MKMVEKNLANITEDEAALYDRQIRLWGLDAQKRCVWVESLIKKRLFHWFDFLQSGSACAVSLQTECNILALDFTRVFVSWNLVIVSFWF